MKRVRTNIPYQYYPSSWDRFDPCTNLKAGDVVKVVKLPGCPRPGTMGHCHVADLSGKFIGLVCLSSLYPCAR